MAIQDILNKLLSEPFMWKMRQHMVDGLNQVYKDAIFKGDTNMEVVRSRNTYPALYDRLDAFDEKQIDTTNKLSQKASINYVDAILMDIAKGGPKALFNSIATLKSTHPNGAEGTFLVMDSSLADGAHSFIWDSTNVMWKDLGVYQSMLIPEEAVTTENIAEKAVTQDKLSFSEPSKNRFNKNAVTADRY